MPLYRAPTATGLPDGLAAPAVSGLLFRPPMKSGAAGTTASAIGTMYGRPIRLSAGTIDRISIYHFDTPTASEVMRLGIYTYSQTTGRPGNLVVDAGTVDLSTAAAAKAATISTAITDGVYVLAAVRQGPTNSANIIAYSSNGQLNDFQLGPWMEWSTFIHSGGWQSFTVGSVTGALPSTWGTATMVTDTLCPVVGVRYA